LESRVWWRTPGTKTLEFERAFAEFHGARTGSQSPTGPPLWKSPWQVWAITAGDEVIVPDFTFGRNRQRRVVC